MIVDLPFVNLNLEDLSFFNDIFKDIECFYFNQIGSTNTKTMDSFAAFYDSALKLKKPEILRTSIFPYNLNALHYFAISCNI